MTYYLIKTEAGYYVGDSFSKDNISLVVGDDKAKKFNNKQAVINFIESMNISKVLAGLTIETHQITCETYASFED